MATSLDYDTNKLFSNSLFCNLSNSAAIRILSFIIACSPYSKTLFIRVKKIGITVIEPHLYLMQDDVVEEIMAFEEFEQYQSCFSHGNLLTVPGQLEYY